MNKTKRSITLFMTAVMVLVYSMGSVPVSAKTTGKTTQSLTAYTGKPLQLKVQKKIRTLKWKSSNKRIATVSKKGKVTPRKPGNVTIFTKYNGKSYRFKILVKKPQLNKTKHIMYVGEHFTLKLNGSTIKKCTSSDKTIVTVNKKGRLTAKQEGIATITIWGKNKKQYSCRVQVVNDPAEVTTKTVASTEANPTQTPTTEAAVSTETNPAQVTTTEVPATEASTTEAPTESSLPLKEPDWMTEEATSFTSMQTLDTSDLTMSGRYDSEQKTFVADSNYLLSSHAFTVEQTNYRVTATEDTYRIRIDMFDESQNYIGYYDCGNGDIFTPKALCSYITISMYHYNNGAIVSETGASLTRALTNGLTISFEKIADLESILTKQEIIACEVNAESLSNPSNFRNGTYDYSWGHNGEYTSSSNDVCSRNFYRVTKDSYILNVNDSRITIAVIMYDSDGNFIGKAENLTNGEPVSIVENTAYVAFAITKKQWSLNILDLLANGLRIDLADEAYMEHASIVEMDSTDLSDINNWKSGSYYFDTGEYIISTTSICYKSLIIPDGKTYVASLPTTTMLVQIFEFDENGKGITTSKLQNGRKWSAGEETAYYGIVITDTATEPLDSTGLLELLHRYPDTGLSEYQKYEHNTLMKDISAFDYVNEINVGWNLGNSLDSRADQRGEDANLGQEMAWGNPYVSKETIDYVKECGFNTIRIPVTWYYNTYQEEDGTTHIGRKWLDRVQDVVDYAIANDLKVILNTHHDSQLGAIATGVDDEEFEEILKYSHDIWTDIAEYFKDYDELLMFESYNEVDNLEKSWNYSDKAAEQMNQLNQVFVDAVRATGGNNSMRILCVPTLLDGQGTNFFHAFKMPEDTATNKLVLQIHSYAIQFDQDIEAMLDEWENFSKEQNAPLIVGEFGTTKSYVIPELRAQHAANFVARAAERGIKCIWWDNNSDYGIINRNNVDCSGSDTEVINGLIEGSKRIAYEIPKSATLNQWEQFLFQRAFWDTGEIEEEEWVHWGTLTTDLNGDAIPVDSGKTYYSVNLKAIGEADDIWLQYILFYDKDGNFITGTDEEGNIRYYSHINSKYRLGEIPENAAYVRFTINSSTRNVTKTEYESYFNNGNMELSVTYFDVEDVTATELTSE